MTSNLREQARRAERLSSTIGSVEDARKLREISQQLDAQADELERAQMSGQTAQVSASNRK
ncbi:hypothetical protein [Bradyrhizobium japonicum]|uniref:hypothetical protein n=1 Tax=Bradyrhizobium japonicum TaxID=375 RepID=UPI00126A20D6|nr:hypothetical protein [Bradyrhizobium japonicum]